MFSSEGNSIQPMRSRASPRCAVCGHEGRVLYAALTDRLFEAGGRWSLKKCKSEACALVWLDPMPEAEDLWQAYTNYYTHSARAGASSQSHLYHLWLAAKSAYIARTFGYELPEHSSPARRTLGLLLYLFPVRRASVNAEVRFLPAIPNGRLLDVGCGAGEFLATMRTLGWQAEGLDFDPQAVAAAQAQGLDVRQGSLMEQNLPSATYDAITLNHVIEHVPTPLAHVRECRRLLKPGGRLVLVTPNQESLGQRLFREDWRGWEPPRHLHVFGPRSMRRLLNDAGFTDFRIRTHNAHYVWHHSFRLRFGHEAGNRSAAKPVGGNLLPRVLTIAEQLLLCILPEVGECLDATATK